jgi:hypothetical protein
MSLRNQQLLDISVPMGAATPEWPGDQPFHCGWTCRIESGDSVNLAAVTTSFHVGTHADAPLHVHDACIRRVGGEGEDGGLRRRLEPFRIVVEPLEEKGQEVLQLVVAALGLMQNVGS